MPLETMIIRTDRGRGGQTDLDLVSEDWDEVALSGAGMGLRGVFLVGVRGGRLNVSLSTGRYKGVIPLLWRRFLVTTSSEPYQQLLMRVASISLTLMNSCQL
jgi:hypothetical protein